MLHTTTDGAQEGHQLTVDRFQKRFEIHLALHRAWFRAVGLEVGGVEEIEGNEWHWFIEVSRPDDAEFCPVAVGYLIIRGCDHDETWGDIGPFPDGTNLGLQVEATDGSLTLMDFQPFNYTENVWVPSENWLELEMRYRIITSQDIDEDVRDHVLTALEWKWPP